MDLLLGVLMMGLGSLLLFCRGRRARRQARRRRGEDSRRLWRQVYYTPRR